MKSRLLVKAIVIAMISGVVLGGMLHSQLDTAAAKEVAGYLNLVTDVFLRLIKMVIAPWCWPRWLPAWRACRETVRWAALASKPLPGS